MSSVPSREEIRQEQSEPRTTRPVDARHAALGRVLYTGLCASGMFVIAGLGLAFATLPSLSDDATMRVAVVALVLTGATSLLRLRWAGPTQETKIWRQQRRPT